MIIDGSRIPKTPTGMLVVSFLLLLFGFRMNSHATLGETEAQLETRYGKALKTEAGRTDKEWIRGYKDHGTVIRVVFKDGVSELEEYDRPAGFPPFTSAERESFLDANSMGSQWRPFEGQLVLKNEKAIASCNGFSQIIVETMEYAKRMETAEQEHNNPPPPMSKSSTVAFASFPDEMRQGTIEKISPFESKTPANNRDLSIYLPPSYGKDPARRFPVLYAMDGQSVFDVPESKPGKSWHMDYAAEKAFATGCSPEVIIVGVPSREAGGDRANEYRPDNHADAFLAFLVDEVKPAIDAKYRTLPDRKNTAMCGSSYGGLISIWAGVKYPKVFGQIAALSVTTSWCRDQMDRAFRAMPEHVRMYFDVGTDDMGGSPTEELRDREAFMAAHGYTWGIDFVTYLDSGGHHDPCFWSRRVPRCLTFLFGRGTAPAVPGQAGKISVQTDAASVFLTWAPVRGALTYTVLRSSEGNGAAVGVATALTNPYFFDRPLHPEKAYRYSIIAANGCGEGPVSAEVSVTPVPMRDILIPNAGFEIPGIGPGVHLFDVTDACWSFSSDAGLSTVGSYFTQKSPQPPEGKQIAMLRRQSSIEQRLYGFKKGTSYILMLTAAQCGVGTIQKQTLQVLIDSQIVGTFIPRTTEFVKFSTKPFISKGGSHLLKIAGLNAVGDNTALIDSVRISAITGE